MSVRSVSYICVCVVCVCIGFIYMVSQKKEGLANHSVCFTAQLMLNSEFWHERAAFQRSAFGRSTAGNDVVANISISLFSSFFSRFSHFFPPSRPFLIEGVLGSKNLFSESCLERPKT